MNDWVARRWRIAEWNGGGKGKINRVAFVPPKRYKHEKAVVWQAPSPAYVEWQESDLIGHNALSSGASFSATAFGGSPAAARAVGAAEAGASAR